MKFNQKKIKQVLSKSYQKTPLTENEVLDFFQNLEKLKDSIRDDESEEHAKTYIRDFLNDAFYKNEYELNTKEREDLVIHIDKKSTSPVGVILETKSPKNKNEFPADNNLNVKSIHELVRYYLNERIIDQNDNVRHLIITNGYEWYIFDSKQFYKIFLKGLEKDFITHNSGQKDSNTTATFYEIVKNFIETSQLSVDYCYFDIRDYTFDSNETENIEITSLYKILSPVHLLNLSFQNDSNTLDKGFYNELLHIIGLEETKEGSKKIIKRKKKPDKASLIENAFSILKSEERLRKVKNVKQYGSNIEEQYFNISLELVLTWINRILFLKLLEGQLISYNKSSDYAFLNYDKVPNFDVLNKLFFRVLAVPVKDRESSEYNKIPYLNSSLFEMNELEDDTIRLNSLEDDLKLPILTKTVLSENEKKITKSVSTLKYLFDFLNAFNFASDGSVEIQKESKNLINASVLGLIFEKINGYKEGSFYTPGFITMYMARETVRKAVVQKFNEKIPDLNADSFDSLRNYIDRKYNVVDLISFNEIINSLKICDPAVGSGHFLVSVLNEIIAVKSDLGILIDADGVSLNSHSKGMPYFADVENDELIIHDSDGNLFEYNPQNEENRRIQETIFHEKQTIIENCLFGVDINNNSVKICRLRLWIELLKHAYYTKESDYKELETLPNIDINIKCGNSLISKFAIDADLKEIVKKGDIKKYQEAVYNYKNATDKKDKHELEEFIREIKEKYQSGLFANLSLLAVLSKKEAKLIQVDGSQSEMFGLSKKEIEKREKETKKLKKEISELKVKIEELKNGHIYKNSFEWRFEFPEVLSDDGTYFGFDIIIGNPPYMRVQEIQATQPLNKVYYEQSYVNAKAAYDIANLFFELSIKIASDNSHNAYIFPHKFFNADSAAVFRDYLVNKKYIDKIAHFGANMIFGDADTYTCIAEFSKSQNEGFLFQRFPHKSDFKDLILDNTAYNSITYEMIKKASQKYGSNQWILFDNKISFSIFNKIYQKSCIFENIFQDIFQGIATSKDELYIVDGSLINKSLNIIVPISGKQYEVELDLFKPFLKGKDVHRYEVLTTSKYVFFPYLLIDDKVVPVSESVLQTRFPKTYAYVKDHEIAFKARESGKAGKMECWYAYIYPKNLIKFEQPKLSSMEICALHPNVTIDVENLYHTTKVYSWIKKENCEYSYEFLLALANSSIIWWFLMLTGDTLQGDARTFKTNYLNPFPVPLEISKKIQTTVEEKVSTLLKLKKNHPGINSKTYENDIDAIICKVYNLTYDEALYVNSSLEISEKEYNDL